MKLLLDECIDRRLAKALTGHEVQTVPQMNWAGLSDNQLLELAEKEFDIFITVDQNLPFQQNLSKLDLAVFVLRSNSNRINDLKPLAPKILESLATAKKGQATIVSN